MNHPNNPDNNNQDDRGDKLGKRSVLALLDGPSKPQKKFRFLSTQLGYGVDVNQERSSCHQLGSNFTQVMQMGSSFRRINPTNNSNLLHSWGSPSNVFGFSQIPRSEPNAENPRNIDLVESSRQGKEPGYKNCSCEKTRCLNLYCECFASQQYCVNCKCGDCENTTENEHGVVAVHKELLENNPTAFDSKIIGEEHKKGCTCKNSYCQKGYCECKYNHICSNKCSCINSKKVPSEVNTQAEQGSMPANVPVGQHPVPIQRPNSYHPSINNGQTYARMMQQGLQGESDLDDSLFNNNSSSSSSFTLINGSNEPKYDTVPVDVHANVTLKTQQLTQFAENLPNYVSAPSNTNSNNSNNIGWPSSDRTKFWMIPHQLN